MDISFHKVQSDPQRYILAIYIRRLEINLFLFVLNFSNFSTVKEKSVVIGLSAESGIVACHT